ncbi:MAG: hypothetical protein F4X19_01555 [Acidobacteria bacterium]|nr:hypothetical protein [Acidobacteriota bacterium]
MDSFLIQIGKRWVLYAEDSPLPEGEAGRSQDRVDRIIRSLAEREAWWATWMSRLIRAVRDGYYELQNRLDPMERVFNRMRLAGPMRVHFSSSLSESEARARLKSLLAGQRIRHGAWMIVDGLLALGMVPLAPVLVPIPGPNLFFYYPALRTFSHWLAWQGVLSALRQMPPQLVAREEIAGLESAIGSRGIAGSRTEIQEFSSRLKLEQLPEFIARYQS